MINAYHDWFGSLFHFPLPHFDHLATEQDQAGDCFDYISLASSWREIWSIIMTRIRDISLDRRLINGLLWRLVDDLYKTLLPATPSLLLYHSDFWALFWLRTDRGKASLQRIVYSATSLWRWSTITRFVRVHNLVGPRVAISLKQTSGFLC